MRRACREAAPASTIHATQASAKSASEMDDRRSSAAATDTIPVAITTANAPASRSPRGAPRSDSPARPSPRRAACADPLPRSATVLDCLADVALERLDRSRVAENAPAEVLAATATHICIPENGRERPPASMLADDVGTQAGLAERPLSDEERQVVARRPRRGPSRGVLSVAQDEGTKNNRSTIIPPRRAPSRRCSPCRCPPVQGS